MIYMQGEMGSGKAKKRGKLGKLDRLYSHTYFRDGLRERCVLGLKGMLFLFVLILSPSRKKKKNPP